MEATTGLDPDRIIEILESVNAEVVSPVEGLRDRKKRRLRQRISNVATALFLAEGFEAVSVARIAARSEVSEQTVFNYFPTKESMFFDEADDLSRAIAESVRDPAKGRLSEVVRPPLIGPAFPDRWPDVDAAEGLAILRRFAEVASTSPTLRGAQYLAMEPFMSTIATALAERNETRPDDPEVLLIALVIAGLVLIRQRSFRQHALSDASLAAMERGVERDLERAIKIAKPTLDAFDGLRGGRRSKATRQPPDRAEPRPG